MSKVIEYACPAGLGLLLASMGYGFTTWQWWAAIMILIVHGWAFGLSLHR
jgi:hypothetical protein